MLYNQYYYYAELQARGLKKHLKRLNAPKHWMLDKLGGAFVSKNFRLCPISRFASFSFSVCTLL